MALNSEYVMLGLWLGRGQDIVLIERLYRTISQNGVEADTNGKAGDGLSPSALPDKHRVIDDRGDGVEVDGNDK